MEIIVAVLVYLGVLVEGNSYTPVEIDAEAAAIKPQVDEVLISQEETDNAIQAFENSDWWINPETNAVEEWEDEPEEVIIISR